MEQRIATGALNKHFDEDKAVSETDESFLFFFYLI